jgi:transketolase
MALSGLRPFCYTITPFITYRCLEQIRVDVCYHHVPVVIVGTGSGLSYASLGATHHSCEEMGMLRLLPGLAVVAPADEMEVRGAIAAAAVYPGPVYMRIGKKGEPRIHASEPPFVIGQPIPMREGHDVCLLGIGTILPVALAAAEKLEQQGISAAVVSFHTLKPLNTEFLRGVFAKYKIVATIEEHSILGGLGGSIAEWKCDTGAAAKLLRFGCADEFLHETCEQDEARAHFGLTAEAIATRLRQALG